MAGSCSLTGHARHRRERGQWKRDIDTISIKEGTKVGVGWGRGVKKENLLIKDNMTRDDDVVGVEFKASILLVVRGVTEDKAASGVRGEFLKSSGGGVGIVGITKNSKVGLGGVVPYKAKWEWGDSPLKGSRCPRGGVNWAFIKINTN
jgi:hypothetical protein